MTTTTQTEPEFGSVEYFDELLDTPGEPDELARRCRAELALRLIEDRADDDKANTFYGDAERVAQIRAILTAYRKVTDR